MQSVVYALGRHVSGIFQPTHLRPTVVIQDIKWFPVGIFLPSQNAAVSVLRQQLIKRGHRQREPPYNVQPSSKSVLYGSPTVGQRTQSVNGSAKWNRKIYKSFDSLRAIQLLDVDFRNKAAHTVSNYINLLSVEGRGVHKLLQLCCGVEIALA